MQKILMICLGNICRSPVADGLLRKKVAERGLDVIVDSCGTNGRHNGESPDSRSAAHAKTQGLDLSSLRSRQITQQDLDEYDRLYVMDASNKQNVLELCTSDEQRNKVKMILEHTHPGESKEVPDPYFGGERGFHEVYDLLDAACEVIADELDA